MTNKIKDIKSALNQKYFEREEEIEALLTAMLAKQHVLFIGVAGTGKSMLSAELNNIVEGSDYFQWLLNQFSTPEELFGVLSLKELEQGVYKRNTSNKLPESHFAFLDEIFKANSAILNSLLTIINERLFYNNGHPVQTPLMSIVGSSNEYPEEGEGLEALFDRFLLRYEVDYIQEDKSFVQMLSGTNDNVEVPSITLEELHIYQQEAEQVNIPGSVIDTLLDIRNELKDEGVRPSDRRFKQSLSLLKAQAYMNGRNDVALGDVELLKNTLWEKPEQKEITATIVKDYAQDVNQQRFESAENDFEEIKDALKEEGLSLEESNEKIRKLKVIMDEVQGLTYDETEKNRLTKSVEAYRNDYLENTLKLF
ncbi:AAA family ATPase [Halobacillus locisalis]|uniref:AAA family ATPase n=1 Tax=Halobacillus locisalis TaxID=220753 RepID=A0A838D028_9BACI|nr:AAA family ATPase [Halobacillus locisalis]MBA2176876.1 AAA family ATPase [Halobacillus locisalis]